jgi:hypothetical protein
LPGSATWSPANAALVVTANEQIGNPSTYTVPTGLALQK